MFLGPTFMEEAQNEEAGQSGSVTLCTRLQSRDGGAVGPNLNYVYICVGHRNADEVFRCLISAPL